MQRILEGNRIWATDRHFLNDTTELRHAGSLILEFVSARLTPEVIAKHKTDNVLNFVEHLFRKDAEDSEALVFVTSFSEHSDSLSQWRAYADDGAGVALGLDLNHLLMNDYEDLAPFLSRPAVLKCEYEQAKQCRFLETIVRGLTVEALELVATKGAHWSAAAMELAYQILLVANDFGPLLKNPGFAEEAEWRVLVRDEGSSISEAVRFRDTKFGPAPYVEVPLTAGQFLPLRHLVFGPKVEKAAKRSVRLMLERYGVTPEMSDAAATYRG
ncbi:MAG TPA: DUF2971 domain-containing protein [Polyangiaceae bacterium]